ncbi:MAG: hypothetical protein J6J01_02565 [Oscillospiraceae bacterium]|nr:hypothetical protein [Oscillospiraceae bacterium]
MQETNQAIAAVKREVQLTEWQQQIQARQEQGLTVDEWCIRLGISKGAYYHRLRKVRKYLCQRMGIMENTEKNGVATETSRSVAVVPIRTAQPNKKATIEMQLGDLQVKFNESPTAEQLKVVLSILLDANQSVC